MASKSLGDIMIPRNEEQEASELYQRLIQAWNDRDASAYAATIATDGNVVGFDGSQMNGSAEVKGAELEARWQVKSQLEAIFRDHQTQSYVTKVLEVRPIAKGVVLLRAAAGMIPEGGKDLNPELNAIQTMVAEQAADGWSIALFQNTPAQFHGRPDLAEAFTNELRKQITAGKEA